MSMQPTPQDAPLACGEIRRGDQLIVGDRKSALGDTNIFVADCSTMDTMFLVENGKLMEDMRGRFLYELLAHGFADYVTGKTKAEKHGDGAGGYRKYYRVVLSPENKKRLAARVEVFSGRILFANMKRRLKSLSAIFQVRSWQGTKGTTDREGLVVCVV